MIAFRRFVYLAPLLTSLSISLTVISTTSTEAHGQNLLLRELAKEDQDSRSGKKIARTDAERVKIVLAQIAQRTLYGTNLVNNQETGKEELVPIDRKTSDAERARYGVPPLAKLLAQYPEQPPRKTK